jgi:hypothetical protein
MCASFWRHTGRLWCEVWILQVVTLSILWPNSQEGFSLILWSREVFAVSEKLLLRFLEHRMQHCFHLCDERNPSTHQRNAPLYCHPPRCCHGTFWTRSRRCCGFWNRLGPLCAWVPGMSDSDRGNLTRSSVKNLWRPVCLRYFSL